MANDTKAAAPDAPETDAQEPPAIPPKDKRLHKATYARDKRKGGYLIRIAGPYPERFAGREVPVTRRDGSESVETIVGLIWTGTDSENGERVALYSFEPRERTDADQAAF